MSTKPETPASGTEIVNVNNPMIDWSKQPGTIGFYMRDATGQSQLTGKCKDDFLKQVEGISVGKSQTMKLVFILALVLAAFSLIIVFSSGRTKRAARKLHDDRCLTAPIDPDCSVMEHELLDKSRTTHVIAWVGFGVSIGLALYVAFRLFLASKKLNEFKGKPVEEGCLAKK